MSKFVRVSLAMSFVLFVGCERTAQGTATRPDREAAKGTAMSEAKAAESTSELIMSKDPCESDADCVLGACCHSLRCVGKDNAPVCEDRPYCNTYYLDGELAGPESCLCHEGLCAATR